MNKITQNLFFCPKCTFSAEMHLFCRNKTVSVLFLWYFGVTAEHLVSVIVRLSKPTETGFGISVKYLFWSFTDRYRELGTVTIAYIDSFFGPKKDLLMLKIDNRVQ